MTTESAVLQLVGQTFDLQPVGPEFRNQTLIPLLSKLISAHNQTARLKEIVSSGFQQYLATVAKRVTSFVDPLDLLSEYAQQWRRYKIIRASFTVSLTPLFKTPSSSSAHSQAPPSSQPSSVKSPTSASLI